MSSMFMNSAGDLQSFTKDHLYFIAKGMDLHVTRKMNKSELCAIIAGKKNEF